MAFKFPTWSSLPHWVKTTLVAAGGGAVSGIVAALATPGGLSLSLNNKDLWINIIKGAVIAVAALYIRSPMGQKLLADFEQAQAQAKADAAMLDQVKGDILGSAAVQAQAQAQLQTPQTPPVVPPGGPKQSS